jgi:hypothetical protein
MKSSHRSSTLVGLGIASSLALTLGFVACAGSPPTRPAPPAPSAALPAPSSSAAATAASVADAGAPVEVDAAVDVRAEELRRARAAQQCDSPSVEVDGHPQRGVVFNNAMTSQDAGFIDRTTGVLAVLDQQMARFRCCFDAAARHEAVGDHVPSDAGTTEQGLMLVLDLAADGSVQRATVDDRRTTVASDLAKLCVVELARSVTYPASPTGKQTVVEYPFRVRAAR